MSLKKLLKGFISMFFRGLLFVVPLVLIVWGTVKLVVWIEHLISKQIVIQGTLIPGFVIALVLLVFIALLGWIGTTIIAVPIRNYFNRLMDNAPLLRTVYSAIKDLMGTVVGQRKSFNQPVLVKLEQSGMVERLGFITQEDLSDLGMDEGRIAVYLPFSYSFSGHLVIVPRSQVSKVDAKSADVMKFIVSGGVANIEAE